MIEMLIVVCTPLVSATICRELHMKYKIMSPQIYWIIGVLTGMFVGCVI